MRCIFVLLFALTTTLTIAQDLYWVDGSGDWTDGNHWSESSGGDPSGIVPDADINAIFDDNSKLTPESIVNIPSGTHPVQNLSIEEDIEFTLEFSGGSGSSTTLQIFGNLVLANAVSISYNSSTTSHTWRFDGCSEHKIITAGKDLNRLVMYDECGVYAFFDNILASHSIRLYGGTWDMNGNDVTTNGTILIRDNQPTSNQWDKTIVFSGSEVNADIWNSKFVYGSLTMIGDHKIRVNQFQGHPASSSSAAGSFDQVYLLDYLPSLQLLSNNMECMGCTIEELYVQNTTGLTRFVGGIIVNNLFQVDDPGCVIEINGGNSNPDNITLNGVIQLPAANSVCDERVLFRAKGTPFAEIIRTTSSGVIEDAIIENVHAVGPIQLSQGILLEDSQGWTTINSLPLRKLFWKGKNGTTQNWSDLSMWIDNGQIPECLSTYADNVIISYIAEGNLMISDGYDAQCKSFEWTDQASGEMQMIFAGGSLSIGGNLNIASGALLTDNNSSFSLQLVGGEALSASIQTGGVDMPNMVIKSGNTTYQLFEDYMGDKLRMNGGKFDTRGYDMFLNEWQTASNIANVVDLDNSVITVEGEMELSFYSYDDVTLDAGMSHIICQSLRSPANPDLYDVTLLNNMNTTLEWSPYSFNTLTLGGGAKVTFDEGLTVNDLIFDTNGTELTMPENKEFIILNSIISNASAADPAIIRPLGSGPLDLEVPKNFCVDGAVNFQNINAVLEGVFHAPDGGDLGGNTNINFTNNPSNDTLYWIGASGNLTQQSNWSNVSGGCPTAVNPWVADLLVFDDNGIFSQDTLTTPFGLNAKNLWFDNLSNAVVIDPNLALTFDTVIIDNTLLYLQDAVFNADSLSLNGGIVLENNSILRTLKSTLQDNSLIVIRAGSSMRIEE